MAALVPLAAGMGTSRTPEPPLRLLLEVTRNADSRVEGRIRMAPTGSGQPFSGVLELLKVLEGCLDRHDSERAATPQPDGDKR
jgi:hypothetical protein